MEEFIKELEEMNLEQVIERMTQMEAEIRSAENNEALEGLDERINLLKERRNELEELEKRKAAALALNNGTAEGKIVEGRKEDKTMSVIEERANAFLESGKTEMRAVLATGNIAKPTDVAEDVSDVAAASSDIVDDVNAIPLTGTGAWVVGYKKTDAIAADVTDGSAIGGTASTYNYVTINPGEWGVLDEVSKQVKKMTPVNYLNAVQKSALVALRDKASSKIVAAVKASALKETVTGATLDENYLNNLILGYHAIKGKGATVLYLVREDLKTLGAVRGTNEKQLVYDITFENEEKTAGTIKSGGMATKFRILDGLTTGTQLFGQPKTIDMPMWDGYEISTDEGGQYFAANQIGVKGLQTAGADLVAWHGMQVVTQA